MRTTASIRNGVALNLRLEPHSILEIHSTNHASKKACHAVELTVICERMLLEWRRKCAQACVLVREVRKEERPNWSDNQQSRLRSDGKEMAWFSEPFC